MRKLSALPEALAFQANNIEQLTTRVTELSKGYDESFDMHNVDLEEVADSEGDSLNPTKMTPPSFASLLNITSADVKGKIMQFSLPIVFELRCSHNMEF